MYGGHGVQVCHGELDTLQLEVLVDVDHSGHLGLGVERVGPTLDQTQYLLLHSCRRVVLWTYEETIHIVSFCLKKFYRVLGLLQHFLILDIDSKPFWIFDSDTYS